MTTHDEALQPASSRQRAQITAATVKAAEDKKREQARIAQLERNQQTRRLAVLKNEWTNQ